MDGRLFRMVVKEIEDGLLEEMEKSLDGGLSKTLMVRVKMIMRRSWRPIRRIHQGRYGVSVPALTKDHEGTRSIRRIQKKSIRRIEDIVCEYSGRYQAWSLLQEIPNTPYPILGYAEVILFYNGLDVPTRHILDSRGRSTDTSDGLAAKQAELNNLGREIKKVSEKVYAAQVGCEQCKGPHYTKDCPLKEEGKTIEESYYTQFGGPFQSRGYRIQIGKISKVLQERGFGSLPSSTKTNPRDQVKSISTTIEADGSSIRRIGPSQYAVSTRKNSTLLYKSRQTTVPFLSRLEYHYREEEEGNYGPKFAEAYGASHINKSIPQKEKDPGSFTLHCFINNVCFDNALVDLEASVSVMPLLTYLDLGLGKLAHTRLTMELTDMTVKYPKGIAKNVLV
ncbi:hypothetical protein Tco_0226583 [Tanacetum coccineum]